MKTETENTRRLNIPGNDDTSSVRDTLPAMLRRWGQGLGYFSMFAALPAFLASDAREARAEVKVPSQPETAAGQRAKGPGGINRRLRQPDFLARQSNYLLPHQKGNPNIANAFTGGDNCPGIEIPNGAYTAAAPFIDNGDTTGANNTVTELDGGFYSYDYSVNGPDLIYSFTITSRGASPEIRVTPSASYNPSIYILDGRGVRGCPSGTGTNAPNALAVGASFGTGATEVISSLYMSFLPLNVPLHLFIDSNGDAPANSGSFTLRMQDVRIAPGPRTKFDFDRDGRAELSVFRPSDGTWYVNQAPAGFPVSQFTATQFGLATDRPVPADYDGDGRTDIAVYRDGVWYWMNSADGTMGARQFGIAGDIPQSADYDGDGRAELAVFRGGVWYTHNLLTNQSSAVPFGLAGDKPVAADYDGDGRTDYAVFRNGTWYLLRSQRGFFAKQFGIATDKLVPADYDGDDRTDLAVFRDGVWYIDYSCCGFRAVQYGSASDIPSPAKYAGDPHTNLAFFRDGVWHIDVFGSQQFGRSGDTPLPAAYLP